MGKTPPVKPPASSPGPFNAALSGLASRMGDVPRVDPPPAPPPKPAAGPPGKPAPARAVVRMERAGRGGRTVTVVEKLGLRPAELEGWLSDLKRALGCGGVVEGDVLVLQGDARERVGPWLAARGVTKVTVA
ncbi:MAG TPA: translation initiation factor [Anaeromyxobacteraceae bacterium]|nr:translation initiation factor [Anaeromyxobacteraceae bacterium]